MPSRPQWQTELDPEALCETPKLRAALKYNGVEVEDLDPGFAETSPWSLHESTPKERQADIQDQRRDLRENLRRSRIKEVKTTLKFMSDDDVRRYGLCDGEGVRPLREGDLPPTDALEGADEVQEMQRAQFEKIQKAAERKGNAICKDFLLSKKRADDSDAKIASLNQRLREFKKEQEEEWKQKRTDLQKQSERRKLSAAKAAEEREEKEDEWEKKAAEKLQNARARRAQLHSTEELRVKAEKAAEQREAAFQVAVANEERTLAIIQAKQEVVEERLWLNRQEFAEKLEFDRQASRAAYHQKQITISALEQDRVVASLQKHQAFAKKVNEGRLRAKEELKERSKSTGDISKRAMLKNRSTYRKYWEEKESHHEGILAKIEAGAQRAETLRPMGHKCGNDIFSHEEVKYNSFKDLQQRKWRELQKAQDAQAQALCLKIAEDRAKLAARDAAEAEVRRQRTEAAKNTLRYANAAQEVFQKIQCEGNEAKVQKAMEGLGFKMPKLGAEEEEEPETAKAAS